MLQAILKSFTAPAFKTEADLEVDFPNTSPEEIHRRIVEDGCCILRNALSPDTVHRYRTMIDTIYQDIALKAQQEGINIRQQDPDRIHVRDKQVTDAFGAENSIFRLLEAAKFIQFMDNLFGAGRHKRSPDGSCARAVELIRTGCHDAACAPLDVHMDALYAEFYKFFFVNFWVPLETCGPGTEYPGLFVFPCSYEDPRFFLGINAPEDIERKRETYPGKTIPTEDAARQLHVMFKKRNIRIVAPKCNAGDIVLFNGWVPHGSYADNKTTRCRRSFEIRFHGDSWNPLTPE